MPIRRTALVAAAVPFLLAVLALTAWASGVLLLASVDSDYIPMAPSTAIGFLITSTATVTLALSSRPRWKLAAGAGLAVLALVSVLKLLEFVTGSSLWDLEAHLVAEPGSFRTVPLARMSPLTALALLGSSIGLLCCASPRRACAANVGGALGTVVAIEGATVILGYAYRAPLLYGGQVIPMALTTGAACLCTGIGLVAVAGPGTAVLRPFVGPSAKARLLRLFLPLTVTPILLDGVLTTLLQSYVQANPALLTALFALAFALAVGMLVSSYAHTLGNALDAANLVLQRSRDDLEARVAERTQALQTATAQAEQANRAKSAFLSRMSHDLRTPLNAILGFAQLLPANDLPDDDRESVAHILRGGRHLLALINEVLDIARIEAGQLSLSPEPVSVPDALHQVSTLMRPLADARHLSLVVDVPHTSGAPYVLADSQRLHQVLGNLLSNAIKYNRERGEIRLTAVSTDEWVEVSVSDTGPGLHPAQVARLFTPFERLGAEQTAIEGTGLGLALSKSLVEAMAGRMGVQSEVSLGSRFWFTLPLCAAPAILHEAHEAGSVAEAGHVSGTVLYVEDNLDNLRLMQRVLASRPQVTLVHASDGQRALALASAAPPDLILLDLHLPDMSGADVLRSLRLLERARHVPVVILSADATPAQKRAMLDAGAVRYVTKPFNLLRLLEVLDEMLSRAGHADRRAS